MKKIIRITIIIVAFIIGTAHAETLTITAKEQILSSFDSRGEFINALRKRPRIILYNLNAFPVNIRLNEFVRPGVAELPSGTEFGLSSNSPLAVQIDGQHGYLYESRPINNPSEVSNSIGDSDLQGGEMCDLDMYQAITPDPNTAYQVCNWTPVKITISWPDSFLRNADSAVRKVEPIVGDLQYFYQRENNSSPES